MKLLLPKVIHHLENKHFLVHGYDTDQRIAGKKDRFRAQLRSSTVPLMKAAQKFIFDSGMDRDHATIDAVRDTALNMMQAGLFHLPFPSIWIEDHFAEDDAKVLAEKAAPGYCVPSCNFYLCQERAGVIEIRMFSAMSQPALSAWLVAYEDVTSINLAALTDEICMNGQLMIGRRTREEYDAGSFAGAILARSRLNAKVKSGEADYALKKFLVTLATAQAVREHVAANPAKARLPDKWRDYDHIIVRVPLDTGDRDSDRAVYRAGGKRRKHLVRGYTWGKNTRPVEQQRWIAPFWRGDGEAIGTVEHDHYEIGRSKGAST